MAHETLKELSWFILVFEILLDLVGGESISLKNHQIFLGDPSSAYNGVIYCGGQNIRGWDFGAVWKRENVFFRKILACRFARFAFLQKSDKGQIFYWSSQTCSRIRLLFVDCRLSPCSKTWKLAYFRPFQPDTQILSALTALYWPSSAFYWPSTTKHQPVPPYTNPVPSCINHYRHVLIQYH